MLLEVLWILGISLGLGFFSTWFSSPRFWRYKLIERNKTKGAKFKWIFKSGDEKHRATLNYWLSSQPKIFCISSAFYFSALMLLKRWTFFNGAILLGLLLSYVFKFILLSDISILPKEHTRKTVRFWIIFFIIYLSLFIDDTIQYQTVPISEKYERVTLSEALSEGNFQISKKDLVELFTNSISDSSELYFVNNKLVIKTSNDFFTIGSNNKITFIDGIQPSLTQAFSTFTVPIQLKIRNPKEIGFTVNDDNQPYFVYALLKKNHILGEYFIDEYALWNPNRDEITYWEKLPDFARQQK